MSKKKFKNISIFPSNRKNPFKDDVIEHIEEGKKTIFAKGKSRDVIIDSDTKEQKGHAIFAKQIKVDKARFTKIYLSSLGSLTNLSKTGLKVLKYTIESLMPNKDFILFDMDDAKKSTGYKSDRSIFNGIAELLEADIIARGKNHYIYYINPTMIFNGDRLTLMADYVVDNSSKYHTNTLPPFDRKIIKEKDIF